MLTWLLLVSLAAPTQDFEIVLSEGLLAGLLTAASPIEYVYQPNTGPTVQLTVTLSDPQVRVSNAAIKVTMNYHARDASGLIDTRGVAKPDLIIVPNPSRGVFEARFVRLIVSLPGGIEVPAEGALKPIDIPALLTESVSLGARTVVASGKGESVQLETGKVHLRGTMTFKTAGK
jgi:hypothetical protein